MANATSQVISGALDAIGGAGYATSQVVGGALSADPSSAGGLLAPGSLLTRVATYRLGGKEDVDLTAVSAHNLFVTSSIQQAVVQYVVLRCKSASGVTVAAKAGVGVNAGADDILTARRLHGLLAADLVYVFVADGGGVRVNSLESIRLGIDEGATASSQIADVDLMGYAF